jgi:hypothetical protein
MSRRNRNCGGRREFRRSGRNVSFGACALSANPLPGAKFGSLDVGIFADPIEVRLKREN